ncbi:MAG: hypothetical protein C0501_29345 [Isosphaera sp.]|nr:hypothetical protein [Isosphaera sp.]
MSRFSLLTVLALAAPARAADPPPVRGEWPTYAGANGAFAAPADVRLIDDMTRLRPVWDSEEQRVGYGKTATTGVPKDFGDLPPGGIASPVVAGGLVILSYFTPSGDVIDAAFKERDGGRDKSDVRYKVSADDVVLAMDAATGKTRWKFVAAGKGASLPMGKRGGYGVTPCAAGGKVFAVGTTGRVYALDLASGKLLWESDVGPRHTQLEAQKKVALEKKTVLPAAAGNFQAVYGMPVVAGGVVVTSDLNRGLVALDPATGKRLWASAEKEEWTSAFNMPAVVAVDGRARVATVNRLGHLRLIDPATGKVLWTHDLKAQHLTHPVGVGDVLVVFESNPKLTGADIGKVDKNNPDLNPVGVLAAYRATDAGPKKLWAQPWQSAHVLSVDAGPSRRVAARDGLVYHLTNPEKALDAAGEKVRKERTLHVIDLATGKVVKSEPFPANQFHVWGDRVVAVSDTQHRPRAANPEVWQLYDADPAKLTKLGGGWQVNGPQPAHVATGGYEMPLYDAFAGGFLFARTVQGIRCYDLRAP